MDPRLLPSILTSTPLSPLTCLGYLGIGGRKGHEGTWLLWFGVGSPLVSLVLATEILTGVLVKPFCPAVSLG